MAPRRPATSAAPDPDVVGLLALYRWAATPGAGWDQQAYALYYPAGEGGATYCVAGRTCIQAGEWMFWELTPGKTPWAQHVIRRGPGGGGRGARIDRLARDLLGLTSAQADDLFCETNTLWDIRQAVYDITGVDPAGPAICDQTETHPPHPQDWPVEPPAVATFCTGLVPVGLAVHG